MNTGHWSQKHTIKKRQNLFDFVAIVVPGVGIEPTRPCGQQILSLPRLPFRHPGRVIRLSKSGAKVLLFLHMANIFF